MNEAPFKVGDKVTTNFHESGKRVVRVVRKIRREKYCQSGWLVLLFTPDEHVTPITRLLDSDWLRKVEA